MRGESKMNGRTSYRRLAGAMSGAGALAVAAVFVLSSVASGAVAHPAAFGTGTWWSPNTYRSNSGCAQAHAFPAHWSALTGAGKSHGSASAKTCPSYRGGSMVSSYGDVSQGLLVYTPVTPNPPAGSGGVNVTWNLHMSASEKLTLTSTACPTHWSNGSYFYPYSGGYWYNYSDLSGYCYAESYFSINVYSYLYNTSGSSLSYMASSYWSMFNETYMYNDTYNDSYSISYLNSSYWANNYSNSYSGSYNYSYGGPATFVGTVAPEGFLNATFGGTGYSYAIETTVSDSQYNSLTTFTGMAATSINMATGSFHEDLSPLQVW
jgi:hypothetical protein